jgi:hypothetical protein
MTEKFSKAVNDIVLNGEITPKEKALLKKLAKEEGVSDLDAEVYISKQIKKRKFEVSKEGFEQTKEVFSDVKETLQGLSNLGKIYNESKQLDNENLRIKGDIVKEARNFQRTQMVLEHIFSERRDVINKHFEAIDKGLREGNDQMILFGLKEVSNFVVTNPLGSFNDFKKLLNDKNETLMLDF